MDFSVGGNYFVYPTYGTAGAGFSAEPYKGSYHSELRLDQLLGSLAGPNFVFSGFAVPASSVSLNLSIPLGVAMLSGHLVTVPGSTTVTCAANVTNFGYLKLVRDGDGYIIGTYIEVNVSGIAPADSVALFTALAGASTVISTVDVRPQGAFKGMRRKMAVYSTAGVYSFVPEFGGSHVALLIGAGAAGNGGGGLNNTTTLYGSGGGGGSGAATFGQVDLVAGVPVNLTVGLGGVSSANLGFGGAGGASSFGTLLANGAPISFGNASTGGAAGAGAAASAWTARSISIAGAAGTAGLAASGSTDKIGSPGADAPFYLGLKGAQGLITTPYCQNAQFAGAGGSGGAGRYASGGVSIYSWNAGGSGGDGLVLVFW